MEPGAVLVLLRGPVQEHHLALVPALVRLADVRKVERGRAEARVRRNARYTALVPLAAVRGIALVPDVDRNFLTLGWFVCFEGIFF